MSYAYDLVVLVPDAAIEQATVGLLSQPKRLHIRETPALRRRIIVHPHRDSGVYYTSREMLRSEASAAAYALLLLDHAWDRGRTASPDELARDIEARLFPDWGDRARCVCIQPEVENWVWSDSPHVATALGWPSFAELRHWLEGRGLWARDQLKPPDPKSALEAALFEMGEPKSAAIFRRLASKVSFERCNDPAFKRLCATLRAWFPANQ